MTNSRGKLTRPQGHAMEQESGICEAKKEEGEEREEDK